MYIVDIISDGEQLFDSGIIPGREAADIVYDTMRDLLTTNDFTAVDVSGREITLREIHNGEIRAEATIRDGEVLAAISARY